MSMNSTPSSERLHIGIFGERNVGKSSLINALTGQNLAIVSPVKGTTTDPVRKAMELLPLGPVVLIDTPGVDDQGELGQQRVKKSYQTLNSCDLAILVSVLGKEFSLREQRLLESIQEKNIPCILALSQSDRMQDEGAGCVAGETRPAVFSVSGLGSQCRYRVPDRGNERTHWETDAEGTGRKKAGGRLAGSRKIYTSCGPIGSGGAERKADPSSAADDSGYSGSGWSCRRSAG